MFQQITGPKNLWFIRIFIQWRWHHKSPKISRIHWKPTELLVSCNSSRTIDFKTAQLKLKSPVTSEKIEFYIFNKIEILAHSEMSLVGFGTPKNFPDQTPPASQISAHLINYTQIYTLFCVFLESGSNFLRCFWSRPGERWTHGLLSKNDAHG